MNSQPGGGVPPHAGTSRPIPQSAYPTPGMNHSHPSMVANAPSGMAGSRAAVVASVPTGRPVPAVVPATNHAQPAGMVTTSAGPTSYAARGMAGQVKRVGVKASYAARGMAGEVKRVGVKAGAGPVRASHPAAKPATHHPAAKPQAQPHSKPKPQAKSSAKSQAAAKPRTKPAPKSRANVAGRKRAGTTGTRNSGNAKKRRTAAVVTDPVIVVAGFVEQVGHGELDEKAPLCEARWLKQIVARASGVPNAQIEPSYAAAMARSIQLLMRDLLQEARRVRDEWEGVKSRKSSAAGDSAAAAAAAAPTAAPGTQSEAKSAGSTASTTATPSNSVVQSSAGSTQSNGGSGGGSGGGGGGSAGSGKSASAEKKGAPAPSSGSKPSAQSTSNANTATTQDEGSRIRAALTAGGFPASSVIDGYHVAEAWHRLCARHGYPFRATAAPVSQSSASDADSADNVQRYQDGNVGLPDVGGVSCASDRLGGAVVGARLEWDM